LCLDLINHSSDHVLGNFQNDVFRKMWPHTLTDYTQESWGADEDQAIIRSLPGSSFKIIDNFPRKTPDAILLDTHIRLHAVASRTLSVMNTPRGIGDQLLKMDFSGCMHKLIY